MDPTIGRIVWYQAHGSPNGQYKSVPRAAVVTEVMSPTEVSLAILNPTGMFFTVGVRYDEAGSPGSWRWPPRT